MDEVVRDDGCVKKRVSGGDSIPESEISWFTYMDLALHLGLTVAESDSFTVGMVLDMIYTRLNGCEAGQAAISQVERMATQADYDGF